VTGIDADGDTVRGGLRLVDGELELSLPAEFVDTATYPLLLDPLFGVEFQLGVNDDGEADVGYQHAVGNYLVAWKRRYSAFDHDVYAQFVDAASNPLGAPIWVDATVDVSQRPRVGSVPGSNRYLIVYEQGPSPFGPFALVCRTLEPGGVLGAKTPITTAGNCRHVAVGSEVTTADDDVMVVYRTDSGIELREVTVPPAGVPVASAPVVLVNSTAAAEPEISRSGGPLGHWMVVFSVATAADSELGACVVDRNRAVLAPYGVPFTNNGVDDVHPAVDGDGSTFVVVYQQAEAPGSNLGDIRGARLQFTGSSIGRQALDVAIAVLPNHDERRPHTAWLGPKHCVVFQETVSGTNTGIGAWMVDDTCVPCNQRIALDGLNPTSARNREHSPRVGGRWQFAQNGVFDDGYIAFTEADDAPPFAGSIVCQRVEALGNGQAPVQVGAGCGNGGTAFVGGGSPFVIGSQYFGFYVNGLAAGAAPFLSIGFPGPTLPCGGCTLTDPLSFMFVPAVGGAASSPYQVTCDPGFVGVTFEFQWVSFLTSASPCPAAPGLSASNRLQITLTN
jgi:hypothetical protein